LKYRNRPADRTGVVKIFAFLELKQK